MGNNAFDAEAAKAGKPIQFSRGSFDGSNPHSWEDVHYIGPDIVRGGQYIVQHKNGSLTSTSALRMKPREPMTMAKLAESIGFRRSKTADGTLLLSVGHLDFFQIEDADLAIKFMHDSAIQLISLCLDWHEAQKKAISKSGRSDSNSQWESLQHAEQIGRINEFLDAVRPRDKS